MSVPPKAKSKPEGARRGIQSVGIGLGVLDALASLGEPAPLGAVSEACGLSLSQTHRYLASLIASGMARQDAETGRYDLGPGALRLGLAALARVDAFHVANAALTDYVRASGRTVQIAALGPTSPIILRWMIGSPPVATSMPVGSSLPLLRSATGRIFLAYRQPAETAGMVAREIKAGAGLKPVDVEQLRADVRAAGCATVDEAVVPGLRATAAPIFDFQGSATLSATVVSNAAFDRAGDDEVRRSLIAVCEEITQRIGGSPPPPSGP